MRTTSTTDAELAPQMRLAVARLARRLRQEAEGHVSASMLSALSSVERLGPLTLGALAEVERVQPPSMTRIVARLEEAGFVTRQVDERDRRVARVAVTEAGGRHLARTRTRKDAYLARRVQRFTEDERDLLRRTLPLLERLTGDDG